MADSKTKVSSGKRSTRIAGKAPDKNQAKVIRDHLCQADRKLAKIIEQVGPFTLAIDEMQSSYSALAESIVYQQITGKAAQSICNKIMSNFESPVFPSPKQILAVDIEALRACGLSRGKAMALQDLALKTLEGVVPEIDEMHNLSDEELLERLTAVRGIGPWTVQMLLMFRLGRLDVLPSTDYGVRKGYALTYYGKNRAQSEDLPKPSEIAERAERWRPYRSAASWYLWRSLEIDKVTVMRTAKTAKNPAAKAKAETKNKKVLAASLALLTSLTAFFTTLTMLAMYVGLSPPAQAQSRQGRGYSQDLDDEEDDAPRRPVKAPPKLSVPAYVTYWSHDALGYHPSMALTIENVSDVSLLGEVIQLQAHFRLVSEGILTVYRWQTRLDTISSKQQVNTIAHSKRPFELPIDPAEWPMIECKVICKIGDASSEETQNLVVARIDPVAMSDEDARTQLNSQLGRNRLAKAKMEQGTKKFEAEHAAAHKHTHSSLPTTPLKPLKPPVAKTLTSSNSQFGQSGQANQQLQPVQPTQPLKPLTAVANSLGSSFSNGNNNNINNNNNVEQFLTKSNLPGLGDDFYHFEKALGMPTATDTKDKNWIWANYKKHPQVHIIAGSKGRTGKADVVVCAISQESGLSDTQFTNFAKALAGKFKAEKASSTEHSVRYTGAGRIELVNLTSQSLRSVYFTSSDSGQKVAVIAVSRLPGSVSELLKEEGQRSDLLRFVLSGLGEPPDQNNSNE
ncbi:MAG: DNA-3-methyladenine glycosylase [Candidatus Melainabacteria bacterium]|nr:DNA-3-methyladenine glycosylase [Candidatus Melainabacteria bacterium]